jgi:hypothetical protein
MHAQVTQLVHSCAQQGLAHTAAPIFQEHAEEEDEANSGFNLSQIQAHYHPGRES